MNLTASIRFAIAALAILLGSACAHLPPAQVIANEQTRLDQQAKGYFDRENSAQQKKADERDFLEAQNRK